MEALFGGNAHLTPYEEKNEKKNNNKWFYLMN
jgi:hypothetical protein